MPSKIILPLKFIIAKGLHRSIRTNRLLVNQRIRIRQRLKTYLLPVVKFVLIFIQPWLFTQKSEVIKRKTVSIDFNNFPSSSIPDSLVNSPVFFFFSNKREEKDLFGDKMEYFRAHLSLARVGKYAMAEICKSRGERRDSAWGILHSDALLPWNVCLHFVWRELLPRVFWYIARHSRDNTYTGAWETILDSENCNDPQTAQCMCIYICIYINILWMTKKRYLITKRTLLPSRNISNDVLWPIIINNHVITTS